MSDGVYKTRGGEIIELKSMIAVVSTTEYAYDKMGNVTHLCENGIIRPNKTKEHPMDLMERLNNSFSARKNGTA